MTKEQALHLIDEHKEKLVNPTEMLNWTWLRVTILHIEDHNWKAAANAAERALSS